ncbi:TDRD1_4_6_7 [Acanthosepion pharaonis]|uniref:TDRD1_4_6_7 n=1 Tax=Acanthosepion pharaonis TaxID=158019 RepID=A0A812C0E3_ACAPH|nr:TDRD1_4_6_7 [Sepia pharaonis]
MLSWHVNSTFSIHSITDSNRTANAPDSHPPSEFLILTKRVEKNSGIYQVHFYQMMKCFKAFGQEFNNGAGNNCVNKINKDENQKDTNIKILSEMPELEDIDDDDILQYDILNNRSSNNKTNFTCTNSKKCCEYKINLQPDSKGLFSLSINRKDSCFKSKKDIREKLSQFGSVSDVYFSSDSVVVKIPSMRQILNISKALNEELDMCFGDNSLKRNPENSHAKIYIGNIAVKASRIIKNIFTQYGSVSSVSFIDDFALANLPNRLEAEKTVEMYNNKVFMGHKLVVRLDDKQMSTHNASGSQKKKQEFLKCSPSAKDNQQQEINCQLTNSLTHGITNQETFIKSPTHSLTNKNLDQHKQQMKEENQLIKVSQFDDPFQAEAAKMAVLVKHFQIQPCLSSSSDTLQVMITSVINNELFWGNIFYSLSNDVTDFMVVHNEIQSTALSWPDYILSKKEMKCVALYQDEWYRAWVLNTVRNDAVKVFFLDYGNTSEIDLKYIRSPNESIWKLPPKARAFRIDSNSKKLTTNAENQIFDIKICKSGNMANGFISVASLICH